MISNKKIKSLLMNCAIFFSISLASGCLMAEDNIYWKYASKISVVASEVGDLLVKEGICKDKKPPCAGLVYNTNDLPGGFRLNTFSVRDPAVIKKIEEILQKHFNELPEIEQILYTAHEGDDLPPDSDKVPNRDVVIYKKLFKR